MTKKTPIGGPKFLDKPGEFSLIKKTDLKVDSSYQRKHSDARIVKMAKEWSWVACGAISIALREDAEWYVMDGWHRVMAALHRDDIDMLPCMIFDLDTVAEEASGFLNTNTNRRHMSMLDKFKALLMTENHEARIVKELVTASSRNLSLGAGGNYFTAVGVALRCVTVDEAALKKVWPVILAVCAPDKKITSHILRGLWCLERNMPAGETLTRAHWKNRLISVGYDKLVDAMRHSAGLYGSSTQRSEAVGITEAMNKGLRNKLEINFPREGKED